MKTKIFIWHAKEDAETASKLDGDLKTAGYDPWLPEENILPGHNLKIVPAKAIRDSALFLALLSTHSVSQSGHIQKELKMALDVLDALPSDEIFIIPIYLDECEPVDERLLNLEGVTLKSSYENGLDRVLRTLRAKLVFRQISENALGETTNPTESVSEKAFLDNLFNLFHIRRRCVRGEVGAFEIHLEIVHTVQQ